MTSRAIVTATELATMPADVLRLVRKEQLPVLVTHRGRVEAVIEPTTAARAAATVDLDNSSQVVSARDLGRWGAGKPLRAARSGSVTAVTYHGHPVALITPIDQWDGFDKLFADVEAPRDFKAFLKRATAVPSDAERIRTSHLPDAQALAFEDIFTGETRHVEPPE